MNTIKLEILILWSMLLFICLTSDALETPLLINCGLDWHDSSPKSTSSVDNRVWQTDDDPAFAPPNINDVSTIVTIDPNGDPPFKVARLFWSPVSYTFSLSPGPKFLRLYFSTSISYNNIPPYQFSNSLLANNITLLKNSNPFLNSPQKTLQYEFQIIVPNGENNLNLTFFTEENININNNNTSSVSPNTISSSYGYVNGIEIRSIPDGLYIEESYLYTYVTIPGTSYSIDKGSSWFQTLFRVNVGGEFVDARDDSPGGMMRTWESDEGYLVGNFRGAKMEPSAEDARHLRINYTENTPAYVAPKIVYATARRMGNSTANFNFARNLTWKFDVYPGFDYMVRLHFREMDLAVTGALQRLINVYIGGLMATQGLDIWDESGGFGFPMVIDYVITIAGNDGDGGSSNGSKVALALTLCPEPIQFLKVTDVLLNGVEILKLS